MTKRRAWSFCHLPIWQTPSKAVFGQLIRKKRGHIAKIRREGRGEQEGRDALKQQQQVDTINVKLKYAYVIYVYNVMATNIFMFEILKKYF